MRRVGPLVPDREEHVDFARRQLAVILLVSFDVRRLNVFECKVAAFLIAELRHPLEKIAIDRGFTRLNADEAHPQHLGLYLRASHKRPRSRSAEQRDELAAPHSITSSAVASSEGGTVRPSILAVSALMTSSNFDDCTTGSSTGLAPLRMRPV
jgi:hypothetical protein